MFSSVVGVLSVKPTIIADFDVSLVAVLNIFVVRSIFL